MGEYQTAKDVLMLAVNDAGFRKRFLADPQASAREVGLPEAEVKRLRTVDREALSRRLVAIDKFIVFDPGVAEVAGHIQDHLNGWFGRGDDIVREEMDTWLTHPEAFEEALKDPLVRDAILRDPATLHTVMKNDRLMTILKQHL